MKQVKVLYKFVDGAHFFVSGDEATTGLCVAHKDVAKAFGAVPAQLSKLFKLNHGMDVTFEPALSLMAFAGWAEGQHAASASSPLPGVAGVIPWVKAQAEPALAG